MLGGTAKWRLNTDLLLESCRYVVCVFNGAAQLPFAHGNPSARDNAAFLIGRIAGVEPVQEGDPLFYFGDQWEVPNRKLVRMSDVCMIDIPAFMPAWRNPTIYLSEDEVLEKLGIGGFDELDFTPLAPASAQDRSAYAAELVRAGSRESDAAPARDELAALFQSGIGPGISIDEAKAGLAARFGVAADQIDITIRW
ncbi:MAG: hypothetical protein CMN51_04225 [SAR116 cluster bacterium]|nr:hypothetical protein [SAR116 cluster bacterium]HAG24895.1 hypothetical protein [Alphaproteobacteria bacterium]